MFKQISMVVRNKKIMKLTITYLAIYFIMLFILEQIDSMILMALQERNALYSQVLKSIITSVLSFPLLCGYTSNLIGNDDQFIPMLKYYFNIRLFLRALIFVSIFQFLPRCISVLISEKRADLQDYFLSNYAPLFIMISIALLFCAFYLSALESIILIRQAYNSKGGIKDYFKGANHLIFSNIMKFIKIELAYASFLILALLLYTFFSTMNTTSSHFLLKFLCSPLLFGSGVFIIPSYYIAYATVIKNAK